MTVPAVILHGGLGRDLAASGTDPGLGRCGIANFHRFDVPDLPGVFQDGPVGGEMSGARDVQN